MGTVYAGTLTVPPQTPLTQPARNFIDLPRGMITRVDILIPWGHGGLTGLQIWVQETPILPAPPGAWVVGNDSLYTFPVTIPIDQEPLGVWLVGYNEDEYYEHTFYVFVTLEESSRLAILRNFLQLFGFGG